MRKISVIRDSRKNLFDQMFEDFSRHCLSANESNKLVVGLPGGRTIEAFLLVVLEAVKKMPGLLRNVEFFQVDDFQSTEERPETNQAQLRKVFFDPLVEMEILSVNQFHSFPIDLEREKAVKQYCKELNEFGGRFNVIFLASGGGFFANGQEDRGHVAGIFPDMQSIWDEEELFVYHELSPKPPKGRFTATPKLLRQADTAYGLVLGSERKNSIDAFFDDSFNQVQCPLKMLKNVQRSFLYTDIN